MYHCPGMNEDDHNQRLRLKRFYLSVATYIIWVAFLFYGDTLGVYSLEFGGHNVPVHWLASAMAVSMVMFFLLFITGVNRRFADPSLTLPMMLNALTWAIFTAGSAPDHRALSFTAFIVIFVFGIFGLRAWQYGVCLVYSIIGYALMVYFTLPETLGDARINLEVMEAALLAAMLSWIAYFGVYVSRLRSKLAERHADLKEALALVEELAIRDDLTGLHNRRHVMETLEREHQRTDRHRVPFSVLVLDIDNFKAINDTYGHPVGDEILKHIVARLTSAVRGVDLVGIGSDEKKADTIGRFGGEEFIVVLPHTQLAGAKRVSERVLKEISREPFDTTAGKVAITVSIGVTEYRQGETLRSLLERVDAAMYAAKQAGRDRIVATPPDSNATPLVYRPPDN